MTDGLNQASGVNYDILDIMKGWARDASLPTSDFLEGGWRLLEWTRGESVQVAEHPDLPFYLAGLVEDLGTKNLVADAMHMPQEYYKLGQDNAAMVLNDAATLGVQPILYHLHMELAEDEWALNEIRAKALFDGTVEACRKAHCCWPGGETATLSDMITPGVVILSGSTTGVIFPKNRVIEPKLQCGDRIILVHGSGPHANGYSGARRLARTLTDGYSTELSDGTTYGQALLEPTPIYVPVVQACLNDGINLHYAVNITGHGWRKIMRAEASFEYIIDKIPEPQPVFRFLQERKQLSNRDMYGAYNMNAGFALLVPEQQVPKAMEIIQAVGMTALDAGFIRKSKEGKSLHILPIDVHYSSTDLQVR